jgi:general secretion pathway protein H
MIWRSNQMRPNQMPLTQMRRAAGFTLIEMLVVLAVLGAVLAVTVGAMPRHGGTLDLANAADGVADALRLARARAIATGRPVLFAVLPGGTGYTMDGQARALPPSVQLATAGPPAISFGPEGDASGGTLQLASASRAVQLRVDWLTGRVVASEARQTVVSEAR